MQAKQPTPKFYPPRSDGYMGLKAPV